MNENTPAASGAAPAVSDAMVDAYLVAQRRTVEEADRFGRPNVGGLHTNTVREACRAGILAALASREASPTPLTDEQIIKAVSPHLFFNDSPDGDNSTDDVLKAARALLALASPQVAPATVQVPTETQIYALCERAFEEWQLSPGCFPSYEMRLARLIFGSLATPVQVASTKRQPTEDDEMTLIESQIDGLLEGEGAGEDHANVKSWIAGAGLRESLVCRVHRAISCFERDHLSKPEAASVAPQDDARDAAGHQLLSELAGIDTHDVNLRDHSEAWEALERYDSAISTPAAKPTEPTLPTQGDAK